MADAISIQELIDARTDAKTLEEAVNGDAVTTVLSRLGETYPTLSNALNQIDGQISDANDMLVESVTTLFTNGGLPATPFTTKDLMTASALVDGDYAQVTDDTVNNGLYVKTAGAWVKSGYDPLAQAKTYTDSSITTALNKSSGTFDTLALLTTSPLVDNAYALVANDTDTTKNGHYKKVSGVWTKVAYTTQLEDELAPLSDTVKVKTSKALHQWVDSEFDIVAEIDTDAGLRLVGVEGTVQDVLNSKRDKSDGFAGNIKDLTHAFLDADDKIVMGIDKHSGLRVAGTTVSLQEQIGLRPVKLPHGKYHPNEMFTAECDKYFTNMSISGLQNAPVPYGVMPQRYTVHDNIVNELTLTPPTEYIPINTNYGDNDRVVHPYIAEFKGGFRGFRYLMCITPYTVVSHENPVLLGSNNLSDWDLLDGFKQPLQSPLSGRFFSDSGITYDPINGMLICYWRDGLLSGTPEEEEEEEYPTGYEQEVRYSATRDGIHWTEPSVLASRNPEAYWTSLTIVFNPIDGLWHMFTKAITGLGHYKASNLNDSWVHSSTTSMSGIWHKEVKWVGDKYVLLVNKRDPESNFYFAISSDGDTWTRGTYLFAEHQDALYKATFLPKFNSDGQIAFDVLYTTNHASTPDLRRRFFHTTTNYVTI